ncbi:hypothetical protein AN639_11525 [Candidatus Epulonipiscium fishelsonii]|uniref:Uncharacterized protein n=1 Tax=Candidatus Epulonipiscium fishelsonii TaxID=77094 RepID=A0ACC8X855_9FIRM|nr:hypothetical protein AN396_11485 [Epulopiscium sp. SCG-B11WGA-EpuloA1]ONI43078.1 hypothetical protein AN639_11525 [Epulopiscium sp. SCG-B05WGA-EpuloA1]
MATIKDVAKYAGVSVATVSRVLNQSEKVSTETVNKVLAAIKELEYTPSALGRQLRTACTKNILVIVPSISNGFYSAIIEGVKSEATKNGYNIVVGITNDDDIIEQEYIQFLDTKVVDGLIFLSPRRNRNYLKNYLGTYPIVQCNEYGLEKGISTVTIDNFKAAYDATKYLINLGHKNIAFIGGEGDYTSVIQRKQGFKKALDEVNLEVAKEYYQKTLFNFEGGKLACKYLLDLDSVPTAIFAAADIIAIGAIKQIQDAGKQVGKDIDVIGFDDTLIAKIYTPSVTTISQPRYEIGVIACEILLSKINNIKNANESSYVLTNRKPQGHQNIIVPHKLEVRESTKKKEN